MDQVLSLAALWVLKSTKASLIFPLMVLALVGFRKLMDYTPRIFSQNDLFWLDSLMPDTNRDKKGKNANNSKEDETSGGIFKGCCGGKARKGRTKAVSKDGGGGENNDVIKPML